MNNNTMDRMIRDIAGRLLDESKKKEEERETHYMASRLLTAFNELFEITWADVDFAERMMKDRKADRLAGHPWNGDDGRDGY